MRRESRDCRRICDMQASLFEKSVGESPMGSAAFVRRFMNSDIAREFDSLALLDDSKTVEDVLQSLDEQYGPSAYGSTKCHRDVMHWVGYIYREICYCNEISSSHAYKLLPFSYVASSYEAYHTLDPYAAAKRLLESKGISFEEKELNQKGLETLKRIRYAAA